MSLPTPDERQLWQQRPFLAVTKGGPRQGKVERPPDEVAHLTTDTKKIFYFRADKPEPYFPLKRNTSMAKETGITWADSTYNRWIGCTKVSPACDHCYAESASAKYNQKWGAGVPRLRMSEATLRAPLSWEREAVVTGREHWGVFVGSMNDVWMARYPRSGVRSCML